MNALLTGMNPFNAAPSTSSSADTTAASNFAPGDAAVGTNSVSDGVPCDALPCTRGAPATSACAPSGFNSALDPVTGADAATAPETSDPSVAVAEAFSEDCISDLVGTATRYAPEYYLDYARRRSMAIISPPLPKAEIDIDSIALGAVSRALDLHPRDLDDPLPKFLREPSPEFLGAAQRRSLVDALLQFPKLALASDRMDQKPHRSNTQNNNHHQFNIVEHRSSPMTG